MQGINTARAVLSGLVLAVALTGCASVAKPPRTDVEEVSARASERWQAAIAGDFAKAYGFLAPSYRNIHDLVYYRKVIAGSVDLTKAEVVRTECQSDELCLVTYTITFYAPMSKIRAEPLHTSNTERWIKEEGQWWQLPTR